MHNHVISVRKLFSIILLCNIYNTIIIIIWFIVEISKRMNANSQEFDMTLHTLKLTKSQSHTPQNMSRIATVPYSFSWTYRTMISSDIG